ncbi:MAG: hypothetical protein WAP23_04170 [Candidatus Spechtbacterales bacterium]
MRIILDFDYTLFDMKTFKRRLFDLFLEHGVSPKLVASSYEESKKGGGNYSPIQQFQILETAGVSDISKLEQKFDALVREAGNYLYSDAVPFVEKMRARHSLALLSHGEEGFQRSKIRACAFVYDACVEIVVTGNAQKDTEAAKLADGQRAIFIDDKPAVLAAAKKLAPNIVTVRMNRGEGPYADEVGGEGIDYEVKNLKEVEILLGNL